jgi:hypothetical protein
MEYYSAFTPAESGGVSGSLYGKSSIQNFCALEIRGATNRLESHSCYYSAFTAGW